MQDYASDIRRRRGLGDVAGEVYFPDQTYERGMALLIDRREFSDLVENSKLPDVLPRVIACASYGINSDKALKQTCTSYYVMVKKPDAPAGMFSGVALNQNIAAAQIDVGTAFYSYAD
jgi:hypothetical protein